MMALFRLLPLRAWLGVGALGLALLVGWWVYDTYQDGRAAEAKVKVLEAEIAAEAAVEEELLKSRQEEAATQDAVRALPRRELTPDEDTIARRIFP